MANRMACAAIMSWFILGCAQQKPTLVMVEGEEKPDQPLAAARFRYAQRLSENGTVPHNALLNAKAARDQMIAEQESSDARDFAADWTWLGPGNIGGRIRAIIIHPTQHNVMWLGACSGGVWKTTNSGAAWFPLDDFLPSLAIGCMAIDPLNPDVLYAGTGEGFFEAQEGSSNTAFIRGAGIFKTTDSGASWNQIPSTAVPDFYFVNRLVIHPTNPQLIQAATNTGIFRSTNGGTSWTQTYIGVAYDLQMHMTDFTRLVAGRHDGPPLYSHDGGVTWNVATGASGHRNEVRFGRVADSNWVYAAVSVGGSIRVHLSTNGGVTYALQTTGSGASTYEAYNNVLWVDPANGNNLLLGGVNLHRSSNGGVSFTSTFGSVHADHHVIVPHPAYNGTTNRTIFLGNDGGIYRANDFTINSAVELNNTLGITQLYGAGINPTTGVVVAGAQDNGTMRYSGNTEGWTATFGGDGGFCAADPTDPNYFYGEVQWLFIFRSTNAGLSASYIYNGITDAGGTLCNFIPFYMLDPNNPNRMLAGGRRLWRSNNVKGTPPTWAVIKPTIETNDEGGSSRRPDQAHFADNSPFNISTLAVAEGNSDIVWVGYNNGEVWRTANGTASTPTWTRVDANGAGLPNRWISRIVIDRTNHNRVFVSIMGWTGDNVWRTDNAGLTWTDISGSSSTGIPDAPVDSLAQHRVAPARLFAGTDIGLFSSINGGQTWQPLGGPSAGSSSDGPGTVPVDELVWKNDQTLMVVTHGRGIYLADVPFLPGDANADGAVDVNDLLLVIGSWGTCPTPATCPGDLNNDGVIDVNDLLMVIGNWD